MPLPAGQRHDGAGGSNGHRQGKTGMQGAFANHASLRIVGKGGKELRLPHRVNQCPAMQYLLHGHMIAEFIAATQDDT
jgi:hypothetical protein